MRLVGATVVETLPLSMHFIRVVLEVADLAALELPTAADASIGVYFGESESSPGRTYSVRHCDLVSGRIAVDIVIHGNGPGTDWARRAAHGDVVTIGHPDSWYAPRPAVESQLLVADLAGLPALGRIIEGLPADADAVALVEVLDEDDLEYLPPTIEIVSSVGSGNGVAHSVLADRVKAMAAPGGHDYCWFGGEAAVGRAVRSHLRRELCWKVDQFDVMGYWRYNSAEWDERYAAVGPQLFAAYQQALEDGRDERLAAEEFDEALERAGL